MIIHFRRRSKVLNLELCFLGLDLFLTFQQTRTLYILGGVVRRCVLWCQCPLMVLSSPQCHLCALSDTIKIGASHSTGHCHVSQPLTDNNY